MTRIKHVEGYGHVLVLSGTWTQELETFARAEAVKGFCFSSGANWQEDDYTFLTRFPEIEFIESWEVIRKGTEAFSKLTNLRYLLLHQGQSPELSLSNLPKLTEVALEYSRGIKSVLQNAGVKYLRMDHYKDSDCSGMNGLRALQNLELVSPSIRNLNGLSELEKLWIMGIYHSRTLEDISALRLNPRLEVLCIEACRRVGNLTEISALGNLKVLSLTSMGAIDSLDFLSPLKSLEEFYMFEDTNIVNGDLRVLDTLPRLRRVGFSRNRKHYNRRFEDFPNIDATRPISFNRCYV